MNILDAASDQAEVLQHGGGKTGHLYRMQKAGYPVPDWFCVSAQVYADFLRALKGQIETADFVEDELLKIFKKASVADAATRVVEAEIARRGWTDQFLAVRSSGIGEDSVEHSFAGQYASFLYQKGAAQIQDALLRCWASAYSKRNIAYRRAHGLWQNGIGMAVVIQKMVNSEAAGAAFSRNPLQAGDRDHLLVSSVWGQGEGLVSGELDADHFIVHRGSLIATAKIAEKTHALTQAPAGGLQKSGVSPAKVMQASLSMTEVEAVARMVLKLEQDFGCPQDVEWAFEKGRLYCLQTRPITSLPADALFDSSVNGGEPVIWDNSNIIESYCGVTTPLTFTHVNRCYREVYIQFCRVMGVPESVIRDHAPMFRNMLGLIRGRIYYNLVNWYRLLFLFPGAASNKGYMESMMGVKQGLNPELIPLFDFLNNPPRYALWRKVKLLILTAYRLLRSRKYVDEFMALIERIYAPLEKVDFTRKSLPEQLALYRELEESVLKRWTAPIVNDTRCMLAFGLLKTLTTQWLGAGNASLQNDLLCGVGDLKSTEPAKLLMKIARVVDLGPAHVRERFLREGAGELWQSLRSGFAPDIHALFQDFLQRYGFRCPNELKLEEPDLHDDPSVVITSVQSYVRMKNYPVERMERGEAAIRENAEDKVRAALSPLRRLIYNRVLRWARRAVRDRELLRFERTRTFGVTRRLFRGMGCNFVRLGVLSDARDVFYLTLEEIIAFQEGRTVLNDFKKLVLLRRQEFTAYADTPAPPDRLLTRGAVGSCLAYPGLLAENDLRVAENAAAAEAGIFRGTPCSPGVVEGAIRVVHGYKDAEGLNGEILVTERTDPGWVPLFPACSGLIIERGSVLSHSAVVARELGIPTIVGVNANPMRRLKTGQRVRMDAGKGEVKIL